MSNNILCILNPYCCIDFQLDNAIMETLHFATQIKSRFPLLLSFYPSYQLFPSNSRMLHLEACSVLAVFNRHWTVYKRFLYLQDISHWSGHFNYMLHTRHVIPFWYFCGVRHDNREAITYILPHFVPLTTLPTEHAPVAPEPPQRCVIKTSSSVLPLPL